MLKLGKITEGVFQDIFVQVKAEGAFQGPELWVFGAKDEKKIVKDLKGQVVQWQIQELKNKESSVFAWSHKKHTLHLIRVPETPSGSDINSDFGRGRDLVGAWFREHLFQFDQLHVHFFHLSQDFVRGALHGLGLASYSPNQYLYRTSGQKSLPRLKLSLNQKPVPSEIVAQAKAWARGQNLARHLVNIPPADLNPKSYAQLVRKLFAGKKGVSVKVLGPDQLEKQGFGLLHGVGKGSLTGSYLVHLRYRPTGKTRKLKPVALVGKGVTFDTGGLDIKPSSNMRLMKKDMAGAALVTGLFYSAVELKVSQGLDVYLALAENAVSAMSMRPSDVLISKKGLSVEIENTDAEGRLVMADALYYAATQKGKDEPEVLIDVSTLTGAMRVALGLDVAGFFASHPDLEMQIMESSQQTGELAWPMPLVKKYFKSLGSSVADMMNSSPEGFGGAITAALFLEKFTEGKPWVHFDVMAWNRSPEGPLSEGGNGQCFQILANHLLTD